ncbi:MAG TPA: anthranilate phosphoribosyltransferase [Syntrophorhabdaceae bacterium]|nr:anthranilate phosphoribosyltransferase [Syntrophorhabdaceae bacterium]
MDQNSLKAFGTNIQRLIDKKDLTEEETYSMFREILLNEQPDLQQGAFLAALVAKGETTEEIVGAWRAIYEIDTVHASSQLPSPLFENSGTGMDSLKTFNVSSAAAIVAAACGVRMARHGARAITSVCGTVDMMEAMGIDVECDVGIVEKSIQETGIGLFNGTSPKIHPAALGRILSQIRFGSTLNIAASLAHPCKPSLGLRGVYAEMMLEKTAEAMQAVGYERGIVAYGKDLQSGKGMDEFSTIGETVFIEFFNGAVNKSKIRPEDVGLSCSSLDRIASTSDMEKETKRFVEVLSGRGYNACIDFTCLNAGVILYTAGVCDSIKQGVEMSCEAIENGKALMKLRDWVAVQDSTGGSGMARFDKLLKETDFRF